MQLRWLAVSCLFLVVVGPAAATDGHNESLSGQLDSSQIDAHGKVTLVAPLLAFTRFDSQPEDQFVPAGDGTTPDAAFTLRAHALRVETWEVDPYAKGPRGYVAPLQSSSNQSHADASVEGLGNRPGYQFDVFPIAGPAMAHVSSDCATLQASPKDTHDAVNKVSAASPTFATNVAGAVRWNECGSSNVTIRGSFVLVLWQWDAQLESNGQTTQLPSGLDRTSTAPEPAAGALYPVVSHARQQYLYAEGAVLTIPAMDNTTHWAFLDAPHVATDGDLQFANAAGQLHQNGIDQPVQAALLNIAGGLDLDTIQSTGQNGALQAQVGGRLDSAQADGQPLSFAVTTATTPGTSWLLLGFVGAAVLLAPPTLLVPLRRRAARRHRIADASCKAQDLLNINRCDEAEPVLHQIGQVAPLDPRVRHQNAQLLELRGDLRGAVQLREAVDAALRHESTKRPALFAENLFRLAILGGRLQQRSRGLDRAQWQRLALARLNEALLERPELAGDVSFHSELASLRLPSDAPADFRN